jgi:hypothetical protein
MSEEFELYTKTSKDNHLIPIVNDSLSSFNVPTNQ